MSQLIHASSQLGGALENMPHGGVPSTNVEVVGSYDDIYLPTSNNFGVGQVVTFQVAGVSDYTDLSKSYVVCTGWWQSTGTTGAGAVNIQDAAFTVVPGWPDSGLFQFQNLYYNGQKVSPARGGDQYIQFVNKALMRRDAGYESDNRSTHYIQSMQDEDYSLYTLDDSNANALPPTAADATTVVQPFSTASAALAAAVGRGAQARYNRIIKDVAAAGGTLASTGTATALCQYMYRPELGAWNLGKHLPDRVAMQLELTVADPSFYVQASTTAAGTIHSAQFNITKMELVLHHVKYRREVIDQNNVAMLEKPYEIPVMTSIYQRSNVTGGATSVAIDLSAVYQGARPKMVAVLIQDNAASQNNYLFNPMIFSDAIYRRTITTLGGVSNLYVLINGQQIPRRPYELQASNSGRNKLRQYRDFVQGSSAGWSMKAQPMMSFLQYCDLYSVYLFWSDPLQELHDQWTATEDVNLEVHGVLNSSAALPAAIAVHTICYVPGVLEVDGARSVKLVTRSGELLSFQ